MKTQLLPAAICLFSGLILSQASSAKDIETRYVYKGDDSARSICLAIAKDQPMRLQRALRAERISLTDNKVHTRFTCNGKDLLSFSKEMAANEVAMVLAPRFGEEVDISSSVSVAGTMTN